MWPGVLSTYETTTSPPLQYFHASCFHQHLCALGRVRSHFSSCLGPVLICLRPWQNSVVQVILLVCPQGPSSILCHHQVLPDVCGPQKDPITLSLPVLSLFSAFSLSFSAHMALPLSVCLPVCVQLSASILPQALSPLSSSPNKPYTRYVVWRNYIS